MSETTDAPKSYPHLRTRVFRVLEHRGIKESVFAQRLGISESLLNKIKHGSRSINETFVNGSIRILDAPFDVLFYGVLSPEGDDASSDEAQP